MTGISEDTRLRMEDPVAHVGMAFGLSRFPLHCRLVGGDQRPDVLLERVVAGALPLQERVALGGRPLQARCNRPSIRFHWSESIVGSL
jgi:hypothetical protein